MPSLGSSKVELSPIETAPDLLKSELDAANARVEHLEKELAKLKRKAADGDLLNEIEVRRKRLEGNAPFSGQWLAGAGSEDPMFLVDAKDQIVEWNAAFLLLYPFLKNQDNDVFHLSEVFSTEFGESVCEARRKFDLGDKNYSFQYVDNHMADKILRTVRFSAHDSRYQDFGMIEGELIIDDPVSLDVEESFDDSNALKETHFEDLIEKTDNLVLCLNSSLNVEYSNPAASRLMHLSKCSYRYAYFPDLIHAEDSSRLERELEECIAKGRSKLSFENRLPPKGHEVVYLLWSFHFTYCEDGGVEFVDAIARDITTRRKLEIGAQVAKETAEAADRSKSEFLAMISHEIRTPLNSIIGLSDLMANSTLEGEEKLMLETISSSGNSLLTLINDVLDLSKVESGHITFDNSDLNIRECLVQIYNLFRFRAESKGLDFKLQIEDEVPDWLCSDRERVIQVLNNLIGNALKFTERGSVLIRVSAQELKNIEELDLWTNQTESGKQPYRILFEVEDTGIGVSEEQRVLLFQPFSQANPSIRKKYGGTGLGLVISRKLAKMMGGDIDLESEYGQGSIFKFSMEADGWKNKDNQAVSIPVDKRNHEDVDLKLADECPLDILVVDDVSNNRLVMKTLLGRMGYSPVLVSGGNEALEALGLQQFDLVFMDMLMPEMSGCETTRRIRELQQDGLLKSRNLRIVALTANAMTTDRDECKDAGMDGFLSKPIRFSEIQSSIRTTYQIAYQQDC